MAGIIYELIDVLDAEKECYEGLCTLGQYKQTAVVNKNIEFLQEVVLKEEEFIGRVGVLEKRRDSLMKDIAIVLGISGERITITSIIEKMGASTEFGKQLTQLRDTIKEQLQDIRKQSELNKQLLTDSLEMVNFMINAVESSRGYAHIENYNKPGETQEVYSNQSMFDQKQ